MKLHNPSKILLLTAMMLICATTTLHCQTKLYKQYKHRTDMMVACIMNYPLTDSIKTDITLFQPLIPDHLWPMVEEFNLGLDKEKVYNQFGQEKKYTLYTYNVCKDDIKKSYGEIKSDEDYKDIAILAYNYNIGTIVIFHDIDTKERDRAIVKFLRGTLTEPEKFPSIDNANNKK